MIRVSDPEEFIVHRGIMIKIILVTAAILFTSSLEAVAAGSGMFRSRNRSSGPTTTRTYRSYPLNPGGVAVPDGGGPALVDRQSPQVRNAPAPSPARPSRSKPSYMRADSKAMGRFGQ